MAPLVVIHVEPDDLDDAARFYARAFGLVVGRRLAGELVELLGAAATLHLLARHSGGASPADYGGPPPPLQVDLVVEDLEAARERARAAGATLEGAMRHHAWGSIAQLADPFGNRLCLLQFRRTGLEEAPAAWQPAAAARRAGAA
ncbi:hypothetical protein SAMN06265365_11875 [Tistlia consotensis]|uniref:VOC domain-containing protein n=1 Tax=Tistlia consotensis USBA 355 TaxID=560819 RepID=A0A1Y6CC21_9PROT|nr:VOC family protein [Tistlia consotensis]SMF53946.1 hypothetical protein SAMN05428998_11976 [Tistlia consotensis USBA 355]SNR86261.1 hypothetical protein SAMN06265365_11875 [Tistlia consotensis]